MLKGNFDSIFTCGNCYWGDQCPAEEICEHFDSLNEMEDSLEDNLFEIIKRERFDEEWQIYCYED